MSNDWNKKVELVKELIKAIHKGEEVDSLKRRFREVLAEISPVEIPLIEQQLIRDGISVSDILKLCDLHVELFREFLQARELTNVPKGHPVELLVRENEYLVKYVEALNTYVAALANAKSRDEVLSHLNSVTAVLNELRKIRLHYRKMQMLIFPYLERRGIVAVPRVLWGREDQVIVKLRRLNELVSKLLKSFDEGGIREVVTTATEVSKELMELVFRENKILLPAAYVLLSEGEWAAISELADEIGWLVDVGDRMWSPKAKPIMPYEVEATELSPEVIERLPQEFKAMALAKSIEPDTYKLRREGDVDMGSGFLNIDEIKSLMNSLPIEITYAGRDGRVRYFNSGIFGEAFVRTKTILGRKLEYCHPPRLEAMVKEVFDEIVKGEVKYREFWTRVGGRIIRVLITPVKRDDGEVLGVAEIVEDLTEVVSKPDEVMKKVVVL